MNSKLLTEQHLEFLGFKGGYTCSSASIHVKMTHCWKYHVAALIIIMRIISASTYNFGTDRVCSMPPLNAHADVADVSSSDRGPSSSTPILCVWEQRSNA